MEYVEIKKLIEDMGNSKLDSLDIEFPEGMKIKMKKKEGNSAEKEVLIQENSMIPKQEVSCKEENCKMIKSPMVGTFYSSPSPKDAPFVKVGDKVKKGDVLCVVEAMKLMNEIESEWDGEISEICVQNEQVVEYGMPLFKIK